MAIGRDDYRERREARIDRLEAHADAARAESEAAYQAARKIRDAIPMGQPILVGHHSERHARADQRRMDQHMNKSMEADKRAGYYAEKAQAAANKRAISSDDPDALSKLEDKLARLQAAQEEAKALNAYYRKHKTVKGFDGYTDEEAARVDARLASEPERLRRPVPAWALTNRNAEMSRLKKRIAALHQVDDMEHIEIEFDGGCIVTNEDINRVQIIFDDKPDEETRRTLKNNGFRWAPSEGAWQTQRTPQALSRAKYIFGIK